MSAGATLAADRAALGPAVCDSVAARTGAWARRQVARALASRSLDLGVEGPEHVPVHGPALLAARHYHHLYDAVAVMASVPREVHVMVALDWLGSGLSLHAMRWLTRAARWPGVWRRGDGWRFNREGYELALRLLREGRALLVFPEGYPAVDPARSRGPAPFLPFEPGFLALAERAGVDVPVVPVGLWYAARAGGGWTVRLRFGPPVRLGGGSAPDRRAALAAIEAEVHRLSDAPAA